MDKHELKSVLMALLFASTAPLSLAQMQAVFDDWQQISLTEIEALLLSIKDDIAHLPIELSQVASGYRFQTREQYSSWIAKMVQEKPSKYSKATLETLAIIAYRQPVTRGDIEDIRGVAVSSSVIKTLIEREWIKIAGYRDVIGKPAVLVTTKLFLDYFNLQSLQDLPPLSRPDVLESLSKTAELLAEDLNECEECHES